MRGAFVVFLVASCASMAFPQQNASGTKSAVQPALPIDAETLLKSIGENQKHIEATRKDYIFHRKDEAEELDSKGHVKSTEIKEYEVYFVGPWEIDRLVSKGGKPLSAGEEKKQDADVRKQEAKARERIAKQQSGEDPGKDTITLGKFLAADRFHNLRRDTYQGREVYAMDFVPRADFQAHSLVGKLLKTLGGTIWIDEQARQIVRLEARFLDTLKVGGGLLGSLQKGGNVVFEQQFVNNEVWMPSYGEIHVNARVLFIHKLLNGISTYSDYRKFRVNSKITAGQDLRDQQPGEGSGARTGNKGASLPGHSPG